MLAYKYPPVQAVGVQRIFHLHQQLQPHFEAIHVQTSTNRSLFKQDNFYLNSNCLANVVEIPTNDLRTRRARMGKNRAFLDKADRSDPFYLRFKHLYHAYPFVLFSGDGGYTYLKESYHQAVKLIKEQQITHVFSSFRPWSDHLIAYRLKKRFPELVWVADFRDLPVDRIRKDVWWPGLQARWQRYLLAQADFVTTVSEGLAKRLRHDHQKVLVLRNGIPKIPSGFLTAPQSPRFTITYTGSLYVGLQSADLLFDLLRELLDSGQLNPAHFELHYAGKDDALWEEWTIQHGLHHLSINHGLVSIGQARSLQKESQINLLLSWSAENYSGIMTAKLGDYLFASRPIITLLNGPTDPEFDQLINSTGAGFIFPQNAPDSRERLRTFLLDAYRSWLFSGSLLWQSNPHDLQAYTWQTQVEKLTTSLALSTFRVSNPVI